MAHPYSQRSLLLSLQRFGQALTHSELPRTAQRLGQAIQSGRWPALRPQTLKALRQQGLRWIQQHRQVFGKLAALVALAVLILWNWKLMLALGVGVGAMGLVYVLQRRDWQPWLDRLRPWVIGPQRLLLLCVGTGSVAMLGTYMAASLWESEHNPWLVSSLMLQGFGVMALLLLPLLRSGWGGDRAPLDAELTPKFDPADFDQALQTLAHPEPLQRLLAVRQLQQLRTCGQLSPDQNRLADQALQLLFKQERELAVRETLLRSLQPKQVALNLQLNPKP